MRQFLPGDMLKVAINDTFGAALWHDTDVFSRKADAYNGDLVFVLAVAPIRGSDGGPDYILVIVRGAIGWLHPFYVRKAGAG